MRFRDSLPKQYHESSKITLEASSQTDVCLVLYSVAATVIAEATRCAQTHFHFHEMCRNHCWIVVDAAFHKAAMRRASRRRSSAKYCRLLTAIRIQVCVHIQGCNSRKSLRLIRPRSTLFVSASITNISDRHAGRPSFEGHLFQRKSSPARCNHLGGIGRDARSGAKMEQSIKVPRDKGELHTHNTTAHGLSS